MAAKRRARNFPGKRPSFGLGVVVLAALVALVAAGCVPPSSRSNNTTREEQKAPNVKVANVGKSVTTDDIRYATYAVSTAGPQGHVQSFYDVAYVARGGNVAIIEARPGAKNQELTSTDMPERVKDYLMMSPILGIVGTRRSFEVGETYDGVMLRPEGRPHFTYHAASKEKVGGVDGTMLEVTSVKFATREMDVVLSPNFPLPLYVKEYTGSRPVQIVLVAVRTSDEKGRQSEMAGGY